MHHNNTDALMDFDVSAAQVRNRHQYSFVGKATQKFCLKRRSNDRERI